MIVFRLFLAIDAAAALVALYFFFIGLGDGSVSSFNIAIWLALLGGIAAILVGGWMLSAKGGSAAPPSACSRFWRCLHFCAGC